MTEYPEEKLRSYINFHVDVENEGKFKSLRSLLSWLTFYDIAIKMLSVILGFCIMMIFASFIIFGIGMYLPIIWGVILTPIISLGIWYILSYKILKLEHRLYRTLHTEVSTMEIEEEIHVLKPDIVIQKYMKVKDLYKILKDRG